MKWRRAVVALLVVWAIWEVARVITRLDSVIFTGYTQVGEVVLQGGDPYGLRINTWPPFFLFIATILALLARISLPGALLVWQLGSVAAIWGSSRLLPRLLGERPAPLTASATLVPLLMSARIFQEHLQHTQINLFLLLLIVRAFWCVQRRRHGWGGLALAVAASVRAVPVLFLPYLLYKRAWRAAAWTAAFLVVLNVILPVAAFGPARALERWRSWRAIAATETADPTPQYMNQSLLAALKRLLTTDGGARDPVRYAIASWPTADVVHLFYGLLAGVAIGLAIAFRRHPAGLLHDTVAGERANRLCFFPIVFPLAREGALLTLFARYLVRWRPGRSPGAQCG